MAILRLSLFLFAMFFCFELFSQTQNTNKLVFSSIENANIDIEELIWLERQEGLNAGDSVFEFSAAFYKGFNHHGSIGFGISGILSTSLFIGGFLYSNYSNDGEDLEFKKIKYPFLATSMTAHLLAACLLPMPKDTPVAFNSKKKNKRAFKKGVIARRLTFAFAGGKIPWGIFSSVLAVLWIQKEINKE